MGDSPIFYREKDRISMIASGRMRRIIIFGLHCSHKKIEPPIFFVISQPCILLIMPDLAYHVSSLCKNTVFPMRV